MVQPVSTVSTAISAQRATVALPWSYGAAMAAATWYDNMRNLVSS